jgi:hypothetical protein
VGKKEQEALAMNPTNRTEEQNQLLEDLTAIKRDSSDLGAYKNLYSPAELHKLIQNLQSIDKSKKEKKYTDYFHNLEDSIFTIAKSNVSIYEQQPSFISSTIKRLDQDQKSRTRMPWEDLIQYASEASKTLKNTMKISVNIDCNPYFISVYDPTYKAQPNLTAVYQFAADIYTRDILSPKLAEVLNQTFVENCTIINDWFKHFSEKESNLFTTKQGKKLSELITTMNTRLSGKEQRGYGKDYRLDPAGAIRLQRLISSTMEKINNIS